jgi:transcription elongation factor
LKFDKFGNRKIGAHLAAIMSRVHYLDLCLDSRREQLLRVKQVVGEGMLDSRNLGKALEDKVVNYVYDNVDYLQELSLRTVLKVADLAAIDTKTWEETADFTVLSHKGRMRKLIKAAAAA